MTASVFYKGNGDMVTKLVVGLTDVLHNEFVLNLEKSQMHSDNQTVSVDAYAIPTSISITENETLEWILDTTLPGVIGLLATVEQMKTRLTLEEAIIIKRMPIGGYNSFSLLFGLLNYVPNPAVVYTDFTHTSSITYAIDHETTDYLANAYPPRSAVPIFNVRFTIGERDNIPQHNMPIGFETWFNTNIDALTAKGWELNNPKSRAGFYVAGSLVGDPWEQYLKFANNPYICTINIVEE